LERKVFEKAICSPQEREANLSIPLTDSAVRWPVPAALVDRE